MYRMRRVGQAVLLVLLLTAVGTSAAPQQEPSMCDECWLRCDINELKCLLSGGDVCTLCSCDFIYGRCYEQDCCIPKMD
jgi:hypothetical protein